MIQAIIWIVVASWLGFVALLLGQGIAAIIRRFAA